MAFGGGSGTAYDPYIISNATHLNSLRDYLVDNSLYFLQDRDIDISSFENWVPIGISRYDSLRGNYNGNGYTISGLTSTHPDMEYVGLFGCAYVLDISNVTLVDVEVVGANYTGALIGAAYGDGKISNCSSSGSVVGRNYTGGLIGRGGSVGTSSSYPGNYYISDCHTSGTVRGLESTGGLAGGLDSFVEHSSVKSSYSTCVVSGYEEVGGLVGGNLGRKCIIKNCYATGNVYGEKFVGGIVGRGKSVINCYASGNISGSNICGGIAGVSDASNCYALQRSITKTDGSGKNFGDIVGSDTAVVSNCYSIDTLRFYEP